MAAVLRRTTRNDQGETLNRTRVFGRLVLTTGSQLAEAPWLDGCRVTHHDGAWTAHGWAIRPRPTAGRTLVVAWRGRHVGPFPPRRLRGWGPFAMRHDGLAHWSPARIAWRRPTPTPRTATTGAYADTEET